MGDLTMLSKRLMASFCAVLLFAAASDPSPAATLVDRLNNHFEGGLGLEHLSYRELNPQGGDYLDSELGTLVVPALSFAYDGNLGFIDHVRAELGGQVAFGNVTYTGALQDLNSGATVPYNGTSGETFTNLQLRLGKGVSLFGNDLLTLYGEAGMNYWNRKGAEGTPYGYPEEYRHRHWAGGLEYQLALSPRFAVMAAASYGRTFGAKMDAALRYVPTSTFELGSSPLRQYRLKVVYATSREGYVAVEGYHIHYQYGASAIDANGLMEPASRTTRVGARIIFGYSYGRR
jgi:hypothetical protein